MVINTETLKEISTKILTAVDNSELSEITENVEMYVKDSNLYMCVTNGDYYVKTRMFMGYDEDFHATINANLFLKLISQITTEDVELSTTEESLIIKANGNYVLPLIYKEGNLMSLPEIQVENITCEQVVKGSVLQSILKYNSKELQKGFVSKPVQRLFYIDEEGAITFTTGACVNSFHLDQSIKILLPSKVVKLFKLFGLDADVAIKLGHSSLNAELTQTRISFATDDVTITAALINNDSMINSVPVTAIRGLANKEYPIRATINRIEALQAINRLSLFTQKPSSNAICRLDFYDPEYLVISDGTDAVLHRRVEEKVRWAAPYIPKFPYACCVYVDDLKATLETSTATHLVLGAGESQAITMSANDIINVIPIVETSDD